MSNCAAPTCQELFPQEKIQGILQELSGSNESILRGHNDSSHLLHKLAFLADIGVKASEPGVQ